MPDGCHAEYEQHTACDLSLGNPQGTKFTCVFRFAVAVSKAPNINMNYLRVLLRGQLYDCPSVSEVPLKDMGKMHPYWTTPEHNRIMNDVHNSWDVLYIKYWPH